MMKLKIKELQISEPARRTMCLIIATLTVVITVAFALGGIGIYGNSITVFSAIDMAVEIFDLTIDTIYQSLATTILGLLYIFFFVKAIITSVKTCRGAMALYDETEEKINVTDAMKGFLIFYFDVISNIFIYVVIASLLDANTMSDSTAFLLYSALGTHFIFYAIYFMVANEKMSASGKAYALIGTAICIFCVIIMSRIINTPIVKSVFSNVNNSGFALPQTIKGAVYVIYYVYVEPILMIVILNLFRKLLFSLDALNDSEYTMYNFANAWKTVTVVSAIMIIARGVINIYLYNNITSAADTLGIMSQWIAYIRSDALPLLLISIGARYAILNYVNVIVGNPRLPQASK